MIDCAEVWVTFVDGVWSWFARQIFQPFCYHEGRGQRETEAHPCRIPFPELSTPHERSRGCPGGCWTRNENKGDHKSDDGGDDEGDDDEDSDSDSVAFEGVTEARVLKREGPLVSVLNARIEACAGTCEETVRASVSKWSQD